MCIRDSYSGREESRQKTDSEYADDLDEFIGGIEIEGIILDPVSYTHLDVYKRQN